MKIGILCQYFPPEMAPIGHMISELSFDLSRHRIAVTVVTGYPNHPTGRLFEGHVRHLGGERQVRSDGVALNRCWLYISPSKALISRAANYLSFAFTSFLTCAKHRQDIYLIVSPPLTNAILGLLLRCLSRHYVLNVQDVHPDAAIATSQVRNGLLIGVMRLLEYLAYRLASRITVISDGFKRNLIAKGVPPQKIVVIPNWIDTDAITPQPQDNPFSREVGAAGRFTALYSGTIGLVSGAEIILDVATTLFGSDIALLMVGEGQVKSRIEQQATERDLTNLRFAPFQPRERLPDVLSTASVGLVTLLPGHGANSVPSKILGYLSAARPVIASVDPGSDTWNFVQEAQCGLCVPPGDPLALANAIRRLRADPELCTRLGHQGRQYLETHLRRQVITRRYAEVLCRRR